MFKKVGPESPGSIGFSAEKMTSDAHMQAALRSDSRVHDVITFRAGEVVQEAAENVRSRASEISVPVLILRGANDTLANPADSQALAGGNIEVRVIDGMQHDLLHESGSDALREEIRDWPEAKINF